MKKLQYLFMALLCFGTNVVAQVADSVTVWISRESDDGDPWVYYRQDIDSFSQGLRVISIRKEWANNSWVNKEQTSFQYAGSMVSEEIFQKWDGAQWINASRKMYSYDPSVDSIRIFKWVGSWADSSMWIYERNAIGLDSNVIYQKNVSNIWVNFSLATYSYNADSSFESKWFSYWDTTLMQWNAQYYTFWYKDSLQRDTSIEEQKFNGLIFENFTRTYLEYDSLNRIIYKEEANWNDFDSIWDFLRHRETLQYDSLDRLVQINSYDIPGGPGLILYHYDSLGVRFIIEDNYTSHSGETLDRYSHLYYYSFASPGPPNLILVDDFLACPGDSMPIGAFVIGGAQPLHFAWTPSMGLSSDTVENPLMAIDSAATYVLTVTDSLNNSVSDTINIGVNLPVEILNYQISPPSCPGCSDGYILVNAVSPGSNTYVSSIFPDPGAHVHLDSIYDLPAGIYTICMTNSADCLACFSDTVPDGTVKVFDLQTQGITIAPNPVSGWAELKVPGGIKEAELFITDYLGRKAASIQITNAVTRINVDGWKPGWYVGVLVARDSLIGIFRLAVVDR